MSPNDEVIADGGESPTAGSGDAQVDTRGRTRNARRLGNLRSVARRGRCPG